MGVLEQLSYEQRLQLVVEQDRDLALITVGPDGAIIDWNAGAEALFGWSEAEIAGRPLATIFTAADVADGVPARDMHQAREAGSAADTRWHMRKDGSEVFVQGALVALRLPDGSLAGYAKRLREARLALTLRQSEASLRAMINATPHMVWSADAAGQGDYFNDKMLAFTGLTQEALAGDGWIACVHPEDLPATRDTWRRALHDAAPLSLEFRFRHHAGEYRWVLCRAEPVLDADQAAVTRWMGTNTDIHDQKILAQDLARANQRQHEFLATLAHELRNPLAPIRASLDLIRLAPSGSTLAKAQQIMTRQVDHLVHLVDDLLDLARVTSGKIVLQKAPVLLQDVLQGAIETALPLIRARHHSFWQQVEPAPMWLDADAKRLVQVIANLLTNAAKYTPEHGNISLSVAREGGQARIDVADNGIGIAPDAQPHVFEMFSQVRPGSEQAYGGLGIGLNLVKRLTEKHGGSVQLASAGAGRGSTFTLRLPLREGAPPQPEAAPEDGAGAARSLRILVVDDNIDAADMLGQILQVEGHEVEVAYDAHGALAQAARFQPEVAVLDIGLPGMNGLKLAQALRGEAGLAGVRLIALTGWGTEQDRRQTSAAGFDAHLTKPVSIDALHARITQLVS